MNERNKILHVVTDDLPALLAREETMTPEERKRFMEENPEIYRFARILDDSDLADLFDETGAVTRWSTQPKGWVLYQATATRKWDTVTEQWTITPPAHRFWIQCGKYGDRFCFDSREWDVAVDWGGGEEIPANIRDFTARRRVN